MLLHGFGVCPRHDQGGTGAALRTDGAEEIGVFVALVLRLAWTAAGLGPLVDLAVLLAHPHLVLEPQLHRRPRREPVHNPGCQTGEVFLNVSTASGFWAGCRGLALT